MRNSASKYVHGRACRELPAAHERRSSGEVATRQARARARSALVAAVVLLLPRSPRSHLRDRVGATSTGQTADEPTTQRTGSVEAVAAGLLRSRAWPSCRR